MIVEMAVIAGRYPLLSVGTDLQPLPSSPRRPTPPPATRAMQRAILDLIERGQRDGSLRAHIPAELFPQVIVGALRLTQRFARSNSDPRALGEHIADLLLDGFTTR
ncbi:hypothetical protein [Nocardia miyunensis]|uniref:hypothetical protein n=1 Tax=Nocardia miyunensis TaxID=282684 RepID=UPI0012F4FC89|nr:hypothetical protein [Nocardia miyunensis]